jgi:tRNA pseudouridine38-40 synthase
MTTRLRAVIRYDGTDFAGWQVQPNGVTIQGELERVLAQIAGELVRIHGAGRTDAGVHALAQVCHFDWQGVASPDKLRRALTRMLAPRIRVESVEPVADSFHARYSAVGKRYAYSLCCRREPDPFAARYVWHMPWQIDVQALAALAQRLVGEHDFAGFQGGGATVATTVRTIHSITLHQGGVIGPMDGAQVWRVEFHGNGFLYKMIRNVMGTLVDVTRGRLPETRLDELLASPGPFLGHTAPGHGLTLMQVEY